MIVKGYKPKNDNILKLKRFLKTNKTNNNGKSNGK